MIKGCPKSNLLLVNIGYFSTPFHICSANAVNVFIEKDAARGQLDNLKSLALQRWFSVNPYRWLGFSSRRCQS